MKGFLNWNIIFVCGYQDIAHSQEGQQISQQVLLIEIDYHIMIKLYPIRGLYRRPRVDKIIIRWNMATLEAY
jgi:hypothetical protein